MSRIASGTTITSRDVARATNTSPRQASSVIRRLVRRGLISGVAGTNPRQYVAITDVQASDAPQESALEEKTVA